MLTGQCPQYGTLGAAVRYFMFCFYLNRANDTVPFDFSHGWDWVEVMFLACAFHEPDSASEMLVLFYSIFKSNHQFILKFKLLTNICVCKKLVTPLTSST